MLQAAKRVLPVANLREFFKDTLHGALQHQHLAIGDQTVTHATSSSPIADPSAPPPIRRM